MFNYHTRLLKGDRNGINEAASLLSKGELVAIPTETVYGLAANALNPGAVRRIFEAKGRPQDNPLIVHISDIKELKPLVTEIPDNARMLAQKYWPGPLTMIFHRSGLVPDEVSAGLSTVAIRMPSHPVALAIISKAGVPLAAPSANRSGSPSPTTAGHVLKDMAGRIPAIVDGGESPVGVESTVLDLTGDVSRLLRPGGITPEQIRAVTGELVIDSAVTGRMEEGTAPHSPGMKYRHYSPNAKVVLVKGSREAFTAFVNSKKGEGVAAMCFDGEGQDLQVPFVTYGGRNHPAEQAHRVFDALRRIDEINAKVVYCACPEPDGIGLAVYNRLLRSAGFEVVELDE